MNTKNKNRKPYSYGYDIPNTNDMKIKTTYETGNIVYISPEHHVNYNKNNIYNRQIPKWPDNDSINGIND